MNTLLRTPEDRLQTEDVQRLLQRDEEVLRRQHVPREDEPAQLHLELIVQVNDCWRLVSTVITLRLQFVGLRLEYQRHRLDEGRLHVGGHRNADETTRRSRLSLPAIRGRLSDLQCAEEGLPGRRCVAALRWSHGEISVALRLVIIGALMSSYNHASDCPQ